MARPRRQQSSLDDYVGQRIRERRRSLGLSCTALAERIGVSYQQAYKYERGKNRVSAGRLFEIACELETSLEYFYEGFDAANPQERPAHERMLLDITRHFSEIQNEKYQLAINQLTRALAGRS
jgi:transcriptional regulator with XRE-family HTH domain